MSYAKVILLAYPYIDKAVLQIDKQIEKRCSLSFFSTEPCEVSVEKISTLISDKRHLLFLKEEVDKVLSRLSDTERILIGYKYFNNRPIEGFDYKSRSYFRRQNKLLDKFTKMLETINLDENIFIKEYSKIPYLKSIQIRIDERMSA